MERLLAAIGVACMVLVSSAAEAVEPAEAQPPIVRYTLDNGLDVVLSPDRRVPKVALNLGYRVGAMNEPAGRSGFAHLFEHLMFTGTPAWPNIDVPLAAVGVETNAWTSEDKTLYFEEGLSSTLPLILSIEADRMANLGRSVDQGKLDVQRAVVKNEMRQTVIDAPGRAGWDTIWTALFPKPHPYSKTVLGSLADLDAATLDDVRGFFDTYYVPNNAILVLLGDFDVEAAKALIADTFGRIPRGADVPRPVAESTQPTRVRVEVEDRVSAVSVGLVFSGPPYAAPENGALAIAAELLGNPDYGVLRDRLVATGLAISASADWAPGLLAGRFSVDADAADGVDTATIERELRAAFSDFVSGRLDPADIERARRTLLLSDRVAREPLGARAETIAELTDMLDRPERAFEDDPDIAGATAASVEDAVRRLLRLEDASTLLITPGQRGGFPPVFTDSTGEGHAFASAPRPTVEIPRLAPGEPTAPHFPVRETARLSNGMEIVHYPVPAAPLAYVGVRATGGWGNAPPGKEGLLDLAGDMAYRGAGRRGYSAFAKAASDIGAAVSVESGYSATTATLSVPPQALGEGVALLADAVLRPRFEDKEWRIVVAEALDSIADREGDLPGRASRAGEAAIFPPRPGRPAIDWLSASVKAISLADARTAYARLFSPATSTFLSVGPASLEMVRASLEKSFGGWSAAVPGFTPEEHPPAVFPAKRRVIFLAEPGATQSAIYVATPAPGRDEPGRAEAVAVMRLLGADFTSRLNQVIREQKGLAYHIYGHLLDQQRQGSAMAIEATVQRDNTGAALEEFLRGYSGLAAAPVTQAEVERTITASASSLAGAAETAGGVFSDLVAASTTGRSLEDAYAARARLTKLALEPVRAAAAAIAALDRAVIVVAGDPDVVVPQLKAIGLTDVEMVEGPRDEGAPDAETGTIAPSDATGIRTAHPQSIPGGAPCDTARGPCAETVQ